MNSSRKILTVAIPAYNSEHCIEKCLNSLCKDAFIDRLEVVVINDGSTDGTSKLAHTYETRYPASVMVIDKENAGHGSVINTAITYAGGKYFQVIDADDWVDSSNMPALLDVLTDQSADMVICDFHMVDMRTQRKQAFRTEGIPTGKVYSFSEFMTYPPGARNCCFFHGIIYRTEFYRDTGVRLSEKVFYEDQEYATLPAYYAHTVLPLNIFIYQYQVGNSAQSISNGNQVKNMWQIEKVFWRICDFYCEHPNMAVEKQQYFMEKLSTLLLSYYVAGLLKDPDRSRGTVLAKRMRGDVLRKCPELYKRSRKKYLIACALHMLRISGDMLENVKKTKIYYMIRKHL